MDEYEAVAVVNENEKIELKSAKVVNGDVILTFNESVDTADVNTKFAATDFTFKVNGVGVIGATVANKTDDVATTKVEKNQLRVVAPAGISFATGTITVEVIEAALAKDLAGNGAKNITVTATR